MQKRIACPQCMVANPTPNLFRFVGIKGRSMLAQHMVVARCFFSFLDLILSLPVMAGTWVEYLKLHIYTMRDAEPPSTSKGTHAPEASTSLFQRMGLPRPFLELQPDFYRHLQYRLHFSTVLE